MLWGLFIKGGPVMFLLLLCSIWGLYIIIHKLIYLRANRVDQDLMLQKIKSQLVGSGKEHTVLELRSKRNVTLQILANAIKLSQYPYEEIQRSISDITRREIPRLEKNMNILSSIITVAPILGLMGTVLGLMDIFNVISGGNIGDATALSGGIAEALVTTVTGLAIAVPFIFLYQYLAHRIDIFVARTEYMVNEVVRFCKTHSGVKP